jgi:hypothetical protein
MICAEVLRLRRQRPLMVLAAMLTIGSVVIFQAYFALRHAGNPHVYGPAGGESGFRQLLKMQGLFFGGIAAILIGAEAGTADIASGVFRDLVATGRSRVALFAVRLPAAILTTLALTLVAYGLGLIGVFAYADGLPDPSLAQILEGVGWLTLTSSLLSAVAVGIGSSTGSRAITLTGLIGWQTIGTELIQQEISTPRWLPQLLFNSGVKPLAPVLLGPELDGTLTAVVVLAGWLVLAAAVGLWMTLRRDA